MKQALLAFSFLFLACASVQKQPTNFVELETAVSPEGDCYDQLALVGPINMESALALMAELAVCHGQPVLLEINSPGGSVMAALEIQKAIERHGAPVICVVDGMAASAAFVTLQACSVRTMTPRSSLMAHHASLSSVDGQRESFENAAAMLRTIDEGMVQYCARRMGLAPLFFEGQISGGKEWWLNMENAKLWKAIDFDVADIFEARMMLGMVKLSWAEELKKPATP